MTFEAGVSLDGPSAALRLGIATVFQDLALCENLMSSLISISARKLSPFALDEVSMEIKAWICCASFLPVSPVCANRSLLFPAANARRWRSPDPCCSIPRLFCSTSRPLHSASRRRLKSSI
jgi:hypothetical protein